MNNKETTLITLEKRIKELENINRERTQFIAFMILVAMALGFIQFISLC